MCMSGGEFEVMGIHMGIRASVTLGVGGPHLGRWFLGANQRNTYGNMGIGNFGGGDYASRGVNLALNHMNTYL